MSSEKKNSSRSRTIKLFCPSLSKLIPWVVTSEDQKLDLGSIATTFGLEPSTLKLNGHFISRGVDFISSSVTWKSLLSFFSSRGLSTGTNDHGPLIVDGKICKPGIKRMMSSSEIGNGDHRTSDRNNRLIDRNPEVEDFNMLKKRKIKGGDSSGEGYNLGDHEDTEYNGIGVKRKASTGDIINPFKKKKTNENNSGSKPEILRPTSSFRSACSGINRSLKRLRVDEMILTAPSKRSR